MAGQTIVTQDSTLGSIVQGSPDGVPVNVNIVSDNSKTDDSKPINVQGTSEGQPLNVNMVGQIVVGFNNNLVSDNFARPTRPSTYITGQLVANDVNNQNVEPLTFLIGRFNGGTAKVNRVTLIKSNTDNTAVDFRVHFYNTIPVAANGDGNMWLTDNVINYRGYVDITIDQIFTDGAAGFADTAILLKPINNSQSVYGLIEARGSYSAASAEVFTIILELSQN